MRKNLLQYSIWAICFLIIIFISRILPGITFVNFERDQARDAFVWENMKSGDMQTLGPIAGGYDYYLPPLYYYIVYPFTLFSNNPVNQTLPALIFSALDIVLTGWLVYLLFPEFKNRKLRLVISAAASFWVAVSTYNIVIGNVPWNSNLVPYFVTAYFLITHFINTTHLQGWKLYSLWAIYAAINAILVSLHSTTMFIIPIISILNISVFVYYHGLRKAILPITLSVILFALFMTPYLIGEFGRNFENSGLVFESVFNNSSKGNWIDMFSRLVATYEFLWQRIVSLGNFPLISLIFSIIVTLFGFRINRNITRSLIFITFIIFLLASTGYSGELHYRYLAVIYLAPIILVINSIVTLQQYSYKKIFVMLILICVIGIVGINISYSRNYIVRKSQLINSNDLIEAAKIIPDNANICWQYFEVMKLDTQPFEYIDKYILNKSHRFVQDCTTEQTYTIIPTFVPVANKDFTAVANEYKLENSKVVYQGERYRIVLLD